MHKLAIKETPVHQDPFGKLSSSIPIMALNLNLPELNTLLSCEYLISLVFGSLLYLTILRIRSCTMQEGTKKLDRWL